MLLLGAALRLSGREGSHVVLASLSTRIREVQPWAHPLVNYLPI